MWKPFKTEQWDFTMNYTRNFSLLYVHKFEIKKAFQILFFINLRY